jgi:hypothetical protein
MATCLITVDDIMARWYRDPSVSESPPTAVGEG